MRATARHMGSARRPSTQTEATLAGVTRVLRTAPTGHSMRSAVVGGNSSGNTMAWVPFSWVLNILIWKSRLGHKVQVRGTRGQTWCSRNFATTSHEELASIRDCLFERSARIRNRCHGGCNVTPSPKAQVEPE